MTSHKMHGKEMVCKTLFWPALDHFNLISTLVCFSLACITCVSNICYNLITKTITVTIVIKSFWFLLCVKHYSGSILTTVWRLQLLSYLIHFQRWCVIHYLLKLILCHLNNDDWFSSYSTRCRINYFFTSDVPFN